MGHFKKALDCSLEKWEAKAQSEIRNILKKYRNLNNKIELSDRCVYDINCIKNLIKYNCKGRPANKRLKGSGEEKNTSKVQKENVQNKGKILTNNINRRKCDLYYKIGHYALKFSNRDN